MPGFWMALGGVSFGLLYASVAFSQLGEDTIAADGFEDRGPPRIDVTASIRSSQVSLPGNGANAIERALMIHYLGTGKSIDGAPRRQLPFRAYFASCGVDSAEPRMFVSLTLEDSSPGANPDHPRRGSVFETRLNAAGQLELTGNQQTVAMCNETHGIAASDDCSTVAVLCATDIEQPVSETFAGTFRDLVAETNADSRQTRAVNNKEIIDGLPDLTDDERTARYRYNGEMWLLEWADGDFSVEPERMVIHKGYGGGHPSTAPSLVYSDTDDAYGAAFKTSVFDSRHGGRHDSAALMIVERDGWRMNPDDRGWGWACGYGHVFNIRAFWNPHKVDDDRAGEFGALCTTDGNNRTAAFSGSIAIKYETSNLFEGGTQYLVASSNGGVTNGGGHTIMPIDEQRSIGVLVGAEMEPWHDPNFRAYVAEAEAAARDRYGDEEARVRGLTGLGACNWYEDDACLLGYTRWVHDGTYPLFAWGFWWKDLAAIEARDISRIGIFHTENNSVSRNIKQPDGAMVKWIAQDDDCLLGAPQLVDLKNGRFLLGYGKFQCLSDGFHLRRFATSARNTRSVATLIPSQYYLMEIDADGNALTAPTPVPGVGWGGLDAIVGLGKGRAAWAYIDSPELHADGSFAEPSQYFWNLYVYESKLDLDGDMAAN